MSESLSKAAVEEIFTLEFLDKRYNTNIIRLLTHFQCGKEYYLIFPLADGDFVDYMKNRKRAAPDFLRNFTLSLMRSLKALHCPDSDKPASEEDRERVNKTLARVLHRDLVSGIPAAIFSSSKTNMDCFL